MITPDRNSHRSFDIPSEKKRPRFVAAFALLYGSFQFLAQAALPPVSTAPYDPAGKLPERIANLTMMALAGVVVVFVLAKIIGKIRDQRN